MCRRRLFHRNLSATVTRGLRVSARPTMLCVGPGDGGVTAQLLAGLEGEIYTVLRRSTRLPINLEPSESPLLTVLCFQQPSDFCRIRLTRLNELRQDTEHETSI